MQPTIPTRPPPSVVLPGATEVTVTHATTPVSTAPLTARPETDAGRGGSAERVIQITPTRTHLERLQVTQAVCENQTRQPCFLSVADAALALRGLERYFGPLFKRYRLSLSEVRESLLWAEEECGGALLVEDVIQTLVARVWQEQRAQRRQNPGGVA